MQPFIGHASPFNKSMILKQISVLDKFSFGYISAPRHLLFTVFMSSPKIKGE